MGTTLTGTQIQNTYDGLIKTTDNTAITATTKLISDGLGNDTCIKVGTAGTDFLGAVDFSAATVTGLPGGAAGLESGTGIDSMQSAASLTTVAANAAGACAINLGNNSTSNSSQSGQIGIGNGSNAFGLNDISIGTSSSNTGSNSIVIGPSAQIGFGQGAVAIGQSSQASAGDFSASVSIGKTATSVNNGTSVGNNARSQGNGVALGQNSFNGAQFGNIAIGGGACASAVGSEGAGVVGYAGRVCAARSFGIGYVVRICNVGSTDSIAFGNFASIGNPNGSNAFTCGAALGTNTQVCANSATALGAGVTATRANTVTSCQMEACVAGKGIVVTSPDGLTTLGIGIDNTGAIVTYTP